MRNDIYNPTNNNHYINQLFLIILHKQVD